MLEPMRTGVCLATIAATAAIGFCAASSGVVSATPPGPAAVNAGCSSSIADAEVLRKYAGEFGAWWDKNRLSRAMGETYLVVIRGRTARLKETLSDTTNRDLAWSIRKTLTDGMNNAQTNGEARKTQQWAVTRADRLLTCLRQGTC